MTGRPLISRIVQGRPGFTLIEVVVATGIVATAALTIIALLIPARAASRSAALVPAAVAMTPGIREALDDRGFAEIDLATRGGAEAWFVAYHAKVLPGTDSEEPEGADLVTAAGGLLGIDYDLRLLVRDLGDPEDLALVGSESGAVEGDIFLVKVRADTDPALGVAGDRAALFVVAEFRTAQPGLPPGDWPTISGAGRPIIVVPIAVRR